MPTPSKPPNYLYSKWPKHKSWGFKEYIKEKSGAIGITRLSNRGDEKFTWDSYERMRKRHYEKGFRIPRLPFNMQDLVDEGKITPKECEKYIEMFGASDPEIEGLARLILRKIIGYE